MIMTEDRKRILSMLKEGKISVEEAEELLDAIGRNEESGGRVENSDSGRPDPKYLKVIVKSKPGADGHENVNIRIPLQLIRAGIKLGSLIPHGAHGKVDHAFREKGIDIDLKNLKAEDLSQIIESLRDMSIDVDSDDETVRIYCE
jgi:hypothetical protein